MFWYILLTTGLGLAIIRSASYSPRKHIRVTGSLRVTQINGYVYRGPKSTYVQLR